MENDNGIKIISCRICRESTDSHKVTFEFDSDWSRMYEFCFGLKVSQYGPQTFCISCSEKLSDYGNFKQLCLQSEETWKSLSADVTLDITNCSLGELNIIKEENIEFLDEFDYTHHDGYGSDGPLHIIKEDKDVKINDFVENLKDKLGEICIDKIKKPFDDKCWKRKLNIASKKTKHSQYSDKKGNLKNTKKKYLLKRCKTSSKKCGVITKQDATEFCCGICDYSSTSQTEVDQHFVQHCQDNDLNCKLCSFEGKDVADMVLHRYTHNQIDNKLTYKCPLCPKKFRVDLRLTFHYRLVHLKQKGAMCKFCGKSFVDYKRWRKHEKLHVTANYTCDHCGLRFLDRNSIVAHMVTHSDVLNFTCDYCGRGFKLSKNLKTHIYFKHTETNQETCTICNRKFKNKLCLRQHMNIHHKEKKYLCDMCSMGFCNNAFLKSHIYYHHSDEKPYVCEICDARYRSKTHLKIHKRKHTGELPYTCAECGKGFPCLSACKRHQSLHTGIRRVKCLHCEKTFYGKKQMLSHCSSKHKDLMKNTVELYRDLKEENV